MNYREEIMAWQTGEGLSDADRAVWEEKVKFALDFERIRVKADLVRKAMREQPQDWEDIND